MVYLREEGGLIELEAIVYEYLCIYENELKETEPSIKVTKLFWRNRLSLNRLFGFSTSQYKIKKSILVTVYLKRVSVIERFTKIALFGLNGP